MAEKEKQIATDTLKIVERGYYFYKEEKVMLPLEKADYQQVRVIDPAFAKRCKEKKEQILAGKIQGMATIRVVNADSFDACKKEGIKGISLVCYERWIGDVIKLALKIVRKFDDRIILIRQIQGQDLIQKSTGSVSGRYKIRVDSEV